VPNRFRKRVVGVAPVVEIVIAQVSQSATDAVWRLQIEALSVAVRCTVPVSSRTVPNPFSSTQVARYMSTTYFSRFPLWARVSIGHRLQMSNATAEAGVRVLKYDELALPHKPDLQLRLDEYIAARIPKRVSQCRLLVTRVKSNLRRKRQQHDITATETWAKNSVPLSVSQLNLQTRLRHVVEWRRRAGGKCTLDDFCVEITAAAPGDDVERTSAPVSLLSSSTLSKIINGRSWTSSSDVERAISVWVKQQTAAQESGHSQTAAQEPERSATPTPAPAATTSRCRKKRKVAAVAPDDHQGQPAVALDASPSQSPDARTTSPIQDAVPADAGTSPSAVAMDASQDRPAPTQSQSSSASAYPITRSAHRASQLSAAAPSDGYFLVIHLAVVDEQLRPFGLVKYTSGALDKKPPRNPDASLTGDVWVPVDPNDLFGPYVETNPLQKEVFVQGSVLHFGVTLDAAGRLPMTVERALTKQFSSQIDEYHDAVMESGL
jgi:hypothetical protein